MPRVNLSDLGNYSGGGKYQKVNYLSLQNDGDTTQVHFLIDSEEDLNNCIYITHNCLLKSVPKLKYGVRVNCLREYSDPIDDCPLCAAGIKTSISCVIPVYNVDSEQVEFWVRGKKEASRLLRKLSKIKNFSSHLFEITRIGEANDQATDYEYDDLGVEEFDDVDGPEILGGPVLDKSADDMEYWLSEKDFPPEGDDNEDEEPVRRRPARKQKDEAPRRRRPSKYEEEDEDDEPPFDEDEEEPVRRKPTGGRKAKRRSVEDEF